VLYLQPPSQEIYLLDVRLQAELQFHTINGRSFTLIRGAIPFPLPFIEKLGKDGKSEADTLPAFPEPMCDDDECLKRSVLVSCTDGKRSYLAADLLLNQLGFTNVKVVSG